ncbi:MULTISPECIES: PhaM family polyhydroxyalkanoate granule multifunctional regulatory protein [Ramlibacter]|uniref:Uncharacterized protein n=1 Tax=Ramlibacter pinisoli TaxID=2682844 RepID=A0A6N8J0X7_9BURK|nr:MULTISPECIES: PhaM family polyhydroxyalkanoate granule multifunctional regulatory protein [Ramlibacter]MBA2963008.1 hypothetical protein [Ramlibacter sp. CGMCC 1.13660]MVQ32951.1 hypothetical protein [Ramlibacter pinisoli]
MSDSQHVGFGKFVPGFDFLQNLAQGASKAIPQMPSLSNWVAPTLSVEELDKRITDMKAVHFWLDQNSKALGATIQALEVQKMTLATLQGMNLSMAEVANALRTNAADAVAGMQKAASTPAAAPKEASAAAHAPRAKPAESPAASRSDKPAGSVIDPLQWWGALTQQFQQIATDALNDAARHTAVDAASGMGGAGSAAQPPAAPVHAAAPGAAAKAPRKAAAKAPRARKTAAPRTRS